MGSAPPSPRWVADAADLRAVISRALAAPAYAMDTEFHRERSYFPHLALLQIAWDDQIALIDPLAVDVGPLAELFAGPGVAVMHAAEQDLEVLGQACDAIPLRLFDTQIAAAFIGMTSPSLTSLVHHVLDVRLPKASRLTDWLHRPLTEEQVAYAAADVAHLVTVYERLVDQLTERGRLSWALDECEHLRARDRAAADPDRAWLRIKEGRSLHGRARGVARAVAAWRERAAASRDEPVRFILPDLAILAIADAAPRTREDLVRVRGVDGRHLREADALLGAIAEGLEAPVPRSRVDERPALAPGLRPAVTLAGAWLAQLARDLHLDPAMLATRADIEALLTGDPRCRLTEGWRAALIGSPLQRLLTGDAAVAFGAAGALVVEERSGVPLVESVSEPEAVEPPAS